MPFDNLNKDKEMKDSQRKRSGDCVVSAYLATRDSSPVYDEIPGIHAICISWGGGSSRGVENTPVGDY
jgi:hypothetical protein